MVELAVSIHTDIPNFCSAAAGPGRQEYDTCPLRTLVLICPIYQGSWLFISSYGDVDTHRPPAAILRTHLGSEHRAFKQHGQYQRT